MATTINLTLKGTYKKDSRDTESDLTIPVKVYNGTDDIATYAQSITTEATTVLTSNNVPWVASGTDSYSNYTSIKFENAGGSIKCTITWISKMSGTNETNQFTKLNLTLPLQLGFVSPKNTVEVTSTNKTNSITATQTLKTSYNKKDKTAEKNNKLPIWLWVLIGIVIFAVIAFIVGAIIFAVIQNKKRKQDALGKISDGDTRNS